MNNAGIVHRILPSELILKNLACLSGRNYKTEALISRTSMVLSRLLIQILLSSTEIMWLVQWMNQRPAMLTILTPAVFSLPNIKLLFIAMIIMDHRVGSNYISPARKAGCGILSSLRWRLLFFLQE